MLNNLIKRLNTQLISKIVNKENFINIIQNTIQNNINYDNNLMLGRWKLEEENSLIYRKIDLANNDNCSYSSRVNNINYEKLTNVTTIDILTMML